MPKNDLSLRHNTLAAWEEISRHLLAWPTAQCHGALPTLPTSG